MKWLAAIALLLSPLLSLSQLSGVVNTYIEVTAVNNAESSVDVANVSGLSVDDSLIIIQMQGAEISGSSVDSANGNVTNYNGAGSWEKVHICTISGNTIHFKKEFYNSYDAGGAVQLIPIVAHTNETITDTVRCQAWDGVTGGVVFIYNHGTLDFQAPIDVSGRGFRGGQYIISNYTCSWFTTVDGFAYDTPSGLAGRKGEGIAIMTTDDCGRGPMGNGGGGGNDHNSGGGGGSNISGGGIGGENDDPGGFTCKGYFPGLPGRVLQTNTERLFLGGGGGAGHANNVWDASGAHGAGMVIIITDDINGNGQDIIGYGYDAVEARGDGAGGGGAGGSVFLYADNLNGTLNVDLHGGDGGNMDASVAANTARCFGPGGGGSGGVLRYKTGAALVGVTATLGGGAPGIIVGSTAACNGTSSNAGSGAPGVEEYNGEIPESVKCNEFCPTMLTIDLGPDINTCDTGSVVIDTDTAGMVYLWSNGETTQSIQVTGQDTYWVQVDNGFCLACDTIDVQNFTAPVYPSVTSFDVCDGTIVTLDAENSGATYDWSTGETTQTISVSAGGLYVCNIWNNNCGIAAFFDVFECFSPPNTITPNGDGSNDAWVVNNINNYPGNNLEIYNRRGQVIFKVTEYQNNFDGAGYPAGVYYYRLDLNNGREPITGTITIVR